MENLFASLSQMLGQLNGFVWGLPMLVAILGVGIYLTLGLRALPLRKIPAGFALLFSRSSSDKGDIAPFNARKPSVR